MLRHKLLVLGASAGLAMTAWQVHASNARARQELDALRAELDGLRADTRATAALGAWQARLAPEARADLPPSAGSAATPPSEARAAEPPPADADAPEGAASPQERLLRLDDRFASEVIDAVWAGQATAALQRSLHALLPPGASVRELSCHRSLCRLEVAVRSAQELEDFQRQALYGEDVLWRGQAMMVPSERADGTVAMTAYLVREGMAM